MGWRLYPTHPITLGSPARFARASAHNSTICLVFLPARILCGTSNSLLARNSGGGARRSNSGAPTNPVSSYGLRSEAVRPVQLIVVEIVAGGNP